MAPRQITVHSFGYLEDQADRERFLREVEIFDSEQKREGRAKQILISIPVERKNNDVANRKYIYGYRFLESIVEELSIGEILDEVDFKGGYRLSEVFEFLVMERILNPGSKRETQQGIRQFYNKQYGFTLADVYRALDQFSDVSIQLQKQLNDRIKQLVGRDSSYAFYDVTNYYFDTDFAGPVGTYQQKGVSKEHQLTPIIQLGLFMDANHLPIAMSTFPGNTSDTLTLQPAMYEIKKNYRLGRLIVVADKGLNSKANLDYVTNQGDGYVVSQVLRGPKGKKYQEILFDEKGYQGNEDFRYKLFEEEYESQINGNKKITRKRKVLIYWNREDSEYAKRKRGEKIERANRQVQNNAYGINHSAGEYITTRNIVKATGELSDEAVHRIDYEKIDEDERFDGYFCLITSELDYDYKKIMEVYGQLWRIEESFRISKSDLQTRPIYVRTQKHIEGHMLICYTALLIARLMQYRLGDNELSVHRIQRVLNACTCVMPNEQSVLIDEVGGQLAFKERTMPNGETVETLAQDESQDQVRRDYQIIQKAFGVEFDYAASSREHFNKYLKSIRFKISKPKK
jgi:transposase